MSVSIARKDSHKMLENSSSSSSSNSSLGKSKSRKSSSLPSETVEYLKQWIMSPEHIAHPYPTEQEKAQIMEDTGIEMKQLTNWFVNNRKRYWKPRVEAKIRKPSLKNILMPLKQSRQQSDASFNHNHNISLVDMVTQMHAQEVSRPQTPRRISSSGVTVMPDHNSSLVSPWSVISMQSIVSSSEENSITSSSSSADSVGDLSGSSQETEEPITERETICLDVLRPASSGDVPTTMEDVTTHSDSPSESDVPSRKRKVVVPECPQKAVELTVPRPKFRRFSVELWKDACRSAENVYDHELPSLEEAVTLFGYAVVKP